MKNVNYETSVHFVQDTLSRDCKFIFEAISKLLSGTCCSEEEGNICTWDLLPRVHEALQEHIAFEEKWLFPELSQKELNHHLLQHENLKRQLARASWELECGYGDQFKSIIKDIHASLVEHHLLDEKGISCVDKCVTDSDLEKIKIRLRSPWLAVKAS